MPERVQTKPLYKWWLPLPKSYSLANCEEDCAETLIDTAWVVIFLLSYYLVMGQDPAVLDAIQT